MGVVLTKTPTNSILLFARDLYLGVKSPSDFKNHSLLHFSNEENDFLKEFSVVLGDPTKEKIYKFVVNNSHSEKFDLDIKTACSFKNISLVLDSLIKFNGQSNLKNCVKYIIKNNINFIEACESCGVNAKKSEPKRFGSGCYFRISNKITFKNLSNCTQIDESLCEWEENTSIENGCWFVRLCDYLEIQVKPLDSTPKYWSIDEEEFEEYCYSRQKKKEFRDFARLFSKPIKDWYGNKNYWE